jgi:hypothetical protein
MICYTNLFYTEKNDATNNDTGIGLWVCSLQKG